MMQLTEFNKTDILILLDYLEDNQIGYPPFWQMMLDTYVLNYHHHDISECLRHKVCYRKDSARKDIQRHGFAGGSELIYRAAGKKQKPYYPFDDETELPDTLLGFHYDKRNESLRLCVYESTLSRVVHAPYFIHMIARYPLFDQIKYSTRDGIRTISLWQQGQRMAKMICRLD